MAYNTTPFHGKTARVEKNNVAMSFTDGWTFNTTLDMADISSQGDAWKTGIPGLAGAEGTFNCKFVAGNTEQKAIMDNIITAAPGTKLTDMKFLLDANTNAITGDIYIKGFSVNASLTDKVTCAVNFQFDGAPSLTSAA